LKDKIIFYPCGQPDTKEFDRTRLLRIIGYSSCLNIFTFNRILGAFLSDANLKGADLRGILLSEANFSGANLSEANLSGARLWQVDFRGADLSRAMFSQVVLRTIQWDSETKWTNARGLHRAVGVSPELAQQPAFLAAFTLNQGSSLVGEGKVEEAIQAYNQAQNLDPNLEISAHFWNSLCWTGSLHNRAADVLYACENAVNLEPDNKGYQDSRGLARALTGDLAGALADFQAVLNSGLFDDLENEKQQRQRWVEALKAGENPFTPEEVEALREAEGL
jgi:tetratricopeptide (TPR) repeat protein